MSRNRYCTKPLSGRELADPFPNHLNSGLAGQTGDWNCHEAVFIFKAYAANLIDDYHQQSLQPDDDTQPVHRDRQACDDRDLSVGACTGRSVRL